jgi:hypothetical protein
LESEEYYKQHREKLDWHMWEKWRICIYKDTEIRVQTEERSNIVSQIRDLAKLALQHNDLFRYCQFANLVGDHSAVTNYIQSNGFTYKDSNCVEPALVKHALKFCDQKTANRGLYAHANYYGNISMYENGDTSMLEEEKKDIMYLTQQYTQEFSLIPVNYYLPSMINAAMEVKKMDYDLALCVLNAGAPLGNLVEMTGVNTRFIEWRRHWKRKPVWRKMGKNRERPTNADSILVIEDDAVTGSTLTAVRPFIEKLKPNKVDVCFCGGFVEKSINAAKSISLFDNIMSVSDLSCENILDKLDDFRNKIRMVVTGEQK